MSTKKKKAFQKLKTENPAKLVMQRRIDRLHEIRKEMADLLAEAGKLVKSCAGRKHKPIYASAEAYWLAHCEVNINGSEYDDSLARTIRELEAVRDGLDPDDID